MAGQRFNELHHPSTTVDADVRGSTAIDLKNLATRKQNPPAIPGPQSPGPGEPPGVAGLLARAQAFASEPVGAGGGPMQAALDAATFGLCVIDQEGRLQFSNAPWRAMMGLRDAGARPETPIIDILRNATAFGFGQADQRREMIDRYRDLAPGDDWEFGTVDGRSIRIQRAFANGASVDSLMDVTVDRRALAAESIRAKHDDMTGLPNRSMLLEKLTDAIAHARRGECVALVCIDLNGFKRVNDRFGHAAGDMLLEAVAFRMRLQLREIDIGARVGGDEFAVIFRCLRSPREALIVTQRMIEALSQPFVIGDLTLQIGASAGIQILGEMDPSPEEFLRRADLALYASKAAGGGQAFFYEPLMHLQESQRRQIERELRTAVDSDQLFLMYQPKIDALTGEVKAFEALARWRHPTRGLLEPAIFMHAAEKAGLMPALGSKFLHLACREAASWDRNLTVSVNISHQQILEEGFVEDVVRALTVSGLDSAQLELEVDGSIFGESTPAASQQLRRLKALGVHLTLDNFRLGPLFDVLPSERIFDRVKLNPSGDKRSGRFAMRPDVLRTLAELCRALGLETNAGCIEQIEQLDSLAHAHCGTVQGYAFSRPLYAHEMQGAVDGTGICGWPLLCKGEIGLI